MLKCPYDLPTWFSNGVAIPNQKRTRRWVNPKQHHHNKNFLWFWIFFTNSQPKTPNWIIKLNDSSHHHQQRTYNNVRPALYILTLWNSNQTKPKHPKNRSWNWFPRFLSKSRCSLLPNKKKKDFFISSNCIWVHKILPTVVMHVLSIWLVWLPDWRQRISASHSLNSLEVSHYLKSQSKWKWRFVWIPNKQTV